MEMFFFRQRPWIATKEHNLDLREKYVFAIRLVLSTDISRPSCNPGSDTLVLMESWTHP